MTSGQINGQIKGIEGFNIGNISLVEMHQALDIKARLRQIVDSCDHLLCENNKENDLWSIKEIASYATGFAVMIDAMSHAKSDGHASNIDFNEIIERSDLFCGIAERACQHGR